MAIVMFIDDNPETLELMERSISMLGHQAICCSDETSALQVASQKQPDLIFTDLSLHSLDGLTLLRILSSTRRQAQFRLSWSVPAVHTSTV